MQTVGSPLQAVIPGCDEILHWAIHGGDGVRFLHSVSVGVSREPAIGVSAGCRGGRSRLAAGFDDRRSDAAALTLGGRGFR